MTKNDQWVFQCIHVGTMSGLGNCYVQCCLQTIAVASFRREPARVINDEGQANPRRSGNNQV